MANVKISQLTAATSLAATDQFEVNAGGSSASVTAQKIADFLASVSQTLTNKTFDTAGTGNVFRINGTAVSAVTGTGSAVLSASPTLTGNVGIGQAGLAGRAFLIRSNATGATTAYSLANSAAVQSDVTVAYRGVYSGPSVADSTFTLPELSHFMAAQGTIGASATVTNQYGFYATGLTGAGSNYGFYSNIASASGRWNFYANGTAANYFAGATTFNAALTYGGVTLSNSVTGTGSMVLSASPTLTGTLTSAAATFSGNVGIGAAAQTAINIYAGSNITGGTFSYNYSASGVAQSDVTNTAAGYHTSIGTQAASFTLTNLRHFWANQSTIGLNSTVTNQFGYHASASLVGATNNYGFYSAIASASGRWNFYSAGTAANYFEGATTFNAAITYGGVTLSNSVTGTGSMVLSASPTLTGTLTAATVTASGVVTGLSGTAVGAGANTQAFIKASSTANLGIYYGTGDPSFSAAKGSIYSRTDATTTTTRLWVNTDGSTTWANFTASA